MHLRLRHRLGLGRTLGSLPLFVNFGGQEFKPGRTETLYHVIARKEPPNFPRTHLAWVFVSPMATATDDDDASIAGPKTACQVMGRTLRGRCTRVYMGIKKVDS